MCEELVRFFSDVKNWYQIFTNVKYGYRILTSVKHRYQILASVKIGIKSSHVNNWFQNSHVWRAGTKPSHMWKIGTKLSQMRRTVTWSSQMSVTNWLWIIGIECKMPQILGVFYQCEEYSCMLHVYEIWPRAYFSQSVRYWYEICDVLVPILTCCEDWYQFFTV